MDSWLALSVVKRGGIVSLFDFVQLMNSKIDSAGEEMPDGGLEQKNCW